MSQGERRHTPASAWAELVAGNGRFVRDDERRPGPDHTARAALAHVQEPFAIFFGCSDSRVPAEIVFDQGLGDLFVVRTAGHVIDPSVLGSIEFGVSGLGCPLIVVVGHDSCGAIGATHAAVTTGEIPGGYLRDIVERVMPSLLTAQGRGQTSIDEIEAAHIEATCALLAERSTVISDRIADGSLGIVGAQYGLADGQIRVVTPLGTVTVRDR